MVIGFVNAGLLSLVQAMGLIFGANVGTTITAQLVNMLYNMVDRIYIGHMEGIGKLALTGVGICMPMIMLMNAFAMLVSAGLAVSVVPDSMQQMAPDGLAFIPIKGFHSTAGTMVVYQKQNPCPAVKYILELL